MDVCSKKNLRFLKVTSILVILVFLLSAIQMPVSSEENNSDPKYKLLTVEDTITAGTSQYLEQGIENAINQGYDGVIIVLNTPGGLVDATLDIMGKIVNSPIPVITFVSPSGAIAASAGTFILVSGHVAAMTPGSTCGAAMPVTMQPGEEGTQEADQKTINFLAGHLKSVAREQGRPEEVVEKFVTENLTLNASEALEKNVIEFNEPNLDALLTAIHGHEVTVAGEEITLETENARIDEAEMTFTQQLSHFISNPQIALILFMIGIYGIIFGINMPGTIIPELGGVLSLILALFGLGMFEANTLGIILIVLSVILFIAEVFTPTFGILTTVGVIALVIGGFFLPVEPMLPQAWFDAFQMTVIGMALVTAGYLALVIMKLLKIRKQSAVHKKHGMIGYRGRTTEDLNPEGYIKIRGELWRAKSKDEEFIAKNRDVIVEQVEGIKLMVSETKRSDQEETEKEVEE
ncbi:protein of unknown function DUF107 [Natranaerobius thermophilus JW/NM-WN-LF]|uniref:Uncharacterized protein n=2 Tax=Natranaerobius TaxID=375928 RepID=B2A5G1_NATTJ|nr:protein of unknown function DUF107 [Natranaerobius thermophilus JW/NM-WN-LF]